MPKPQNPPTLPPLPAPRQRLRASRPRATTTAGPFGDRMYEARTSSGLPLDEAAVHIRGIDSTYGPSRETLRRYESGETPEDRADPLIVAAAALIYGVDLTWLSPSVASQLSKVELLAAELRSRKGSRPRARRTPNTRWSSVSETSRRPVTPRRNLHPRAVA